MRMPLTLRALAPIDAKSIIRDPMLRWLIFFPFLIVLLFRWVLPAASAFARARFDFELAPYLPLVFSFLPMMTPMLAGMVVGFLLLDQRDDGTLSALAVTPLSSRSYVAYRLAVPMGVSFVVTVAVMLMSGIGGLRWLWVLAVAAISMPLAPFYALSLAALADNKVQGFAITKAMGILLGAPLLAWFLPTPWQWLLGIVPLYWPAKVLWMLQAGEAGVGGYYLAGLACQALLIAAMLPALNRAARE